MSKKTIIGIIIICVMVIIGIGIYSLMQKKTINYSGQVEKITVAMGTGPVTSLIHIALAKGYFKNEGLDFVLQQHQSGKSALKALLEGKADLATAGEVPIMYTIFEGEKIYILSTISSTEKNTMIIARKDKGVSFPIDLQGKKIGVSFGTSAEYFMDSFLLLHEITRNKVEAINVKPNAIVDVLTSGYVDAVSTWNPNVSVLQKELGDNGVTFSGEKIYRETFNVVTKQNFAIENPETLKKFLRAIISAEELIKENSNMAMEILAGKIGMNKTVLAEFWDLYDFKVTLDQALITTLEAEMRWAITNNLTDKTEVSNLLDYIYMDALEEVNPEAVTILR